jgi:hypothetical protein
VCGREGELEGLPNQPSAYVPPALHLRDILAKIAEGHPISWLDELMPGRFKATASAVASALTLSVCNETAADGTAAIRPSSRARPRPIREDLVALDFAGQTSSSAPPVATRANVQSKSRFSQARRRRSSATHS